MSIISPEVEIWLVDTEFGHPDGEPLPEVRCLVAKEYRSKRVIRLWQDQLCRMLATIFDWA